VHLCFVVAIDYLKIEHDAIDIRLVKSQAFDFFSDSYLLNLYFSLDFKGH
jgi:hypothetical protein